MTADLALDIEHDLAWDGKDFFIARNRPEVIQRNKTRLLFIEGEWTYDPSLGVPWFTEMFAADTSYEVKRQNIVDTTQETEGVSELLEFKFEIDLTERGALVEYRAATVYDTEEAQEEGV